MTQDNTLVSPNVSARLKPGVTNPPRPRPAEPGDTADRSAGIPAGESFLSPRPTATRLTRGFCVFRVFRGSLLPRNLTAYHRIAPPPCNTHFTPVVPRLYR